MQQAIRSGVLLTFSYKWHQIVLWLPDRRMKRVSDCFPFGVPQQDGLFTEGLNCSLTEKTLIQHIPSMFTYRGGWKELCVCLYMKRERERELI